MRRPTRNFCWAACLVLLLGGCGGNDVPGTPTVPTTGASEPPSAQSDAPGYGAPKVANPLDTSGPEARPCENLTDAQVTDLLGTDTNEVRDDRGGPGCRWHSYESQASVAVDFPKITDNGLTAIYAAAKNQQYKFFKEMSPVRGYPAVAWGTSDETITRGECYVAVGTSDRATVEASVALSKKNVGSKDPCEAAHQVLDMVIGNIQGTN